MGERKYNTLPDNLRTQAGKCAEEKDELALALLLYRAWPVLQSFSPGELELVEFWKRLLVRDFAYIRCHCLGHGPWFESTCEHCFLDVS